MNNFNILETTLRDGSYAINFNFSAMDTYLICQELEKSGFKYIEIGHGVGIGASSNKYGNSLESDEDYMKSAADALVSAQFGVFCIPGIAKLEDVDKAAEYGAGFIRIGTNVTEVDNSEPFIKRAKKLGLKVMANYMKSYALPSNEFVKNVKKSKSYGADVVYLVDSAGGMFAEDINTYIKCIKDQVDIEIGFHGHNNLGLAVANNLAAIEAGVSYIDTSLQGLGRSAGNAPTELCVAALMKKNLNLNLDLFHILEIGKKYISPLLNKQNIEPLDIVMGYADFHSSYLSHIQKYCSKYHIKPETLIIEYSKFNKIDIDQEGMEKIAQKLKSDETFYLGNYNFKNYVGNEQNGN